MSRNLINRQGLVAVFVGATFAVAATAVAVLSDALREQSQAGKPDPATLMNEVHAPAPALPIPDSQSQPILVEQLPSYLSSPEFEQAVIRSDLEPLGHDHVIVVKRGNTVSGIFDSLSVPQTDMYSIMASPIGRASLRRIHPGQELTFSFDGNGELRRLSMQVAIDRRVEFLRSGKGQFDGTETLLPVQTRLTHSVGQFSYGDSLSSVGLDSGIRDPRTIMRAANLLAWEVDFWHDPRPGDTFQLIYDRQYIDGNFLADGTIYAVEFVNRGKVIQSFRYDAPGLGPNYYTRDGKSNRSVFLRAPLEYTRVSSSFNLKRFHPILKTVRPHLGIDYAAPRGTPVRSVGDGVVTAAGRTRANGNYVVISHGSIYQTKYLHLHTIKKGVTRGAVVSQGQVLGTVGMTGLATGPHLHYEFLVNGEHRDPKTIPVQRSEPLVAEHLGEFLKSIRPMVAILESARANSTGSIALQD